VINLLTAGGAIETFDVGQYPLAELPTGDRFIVVQLADQVDGLVAIQATSLRLHRCMPDDRIELPTLQPPRPGQPTHADYMELHRIRTRADLLRRQATGQLGHHPSDRRYSPTTVAGARAERLKLDPADCLLCGRPIQAGEPQLEVATIDRSSDGGSAILSVCLPTCSH
jgi:hypothetical protein